MIDKFRPLAAAALIALIGAGCSSAPAQNDAGHANAAARAQAVKFATCMREHGVEAFPDPDASGSLTIDGVVNGSSLDPSGAAWQDAVAACKDLQPPGFTGRRRSARQQAAALKFAQCIRDRGVEDFPDPAPEAPLVDTNLIPSSAAPGGMSALNAAMRACGDSFADKLGLERR